MSRILACALALAASAGWAGEFKGEAVGMCERIYEPREPLKRSRLVAATQGHVSTGDYAAAYQALAQALEQSLDAAERQLPKVPEFRQNLRRAAAFPYGHFQVNQGLNDTNEHIFQAQPEQITIDCSAPVPQHLVDIAAVALVAARVRAMQQGPELLKRAVAVAKADGEAQNLLKNGLPMWPWELWANGLRLAEDDAAPLFRTQWVLLRPTAGIEVDTRNRASADLQASAAIEPVGFVHYRDGSYSRWWGASLLVTSSTSRGLGVGVLGRWDNYVLGVTHHRGEQPGQAGSRFIFVGVELRELIGGKRAELKDWKAHREKQVEDFIGALK